MIMKKLHLVAVIFWIIQSNASGHSQTEVKKAPELIKGRYELRGATVYDKQTDLTWMRCSAGQKWSPPNQCTGKPGGFSFSAAQKLSMGLWRVPTKSEITTLLTTTKTTTKIDTEIFPTVDAKNLLYWTCDQHSETNAWFVDFRQGEVDYVFGDGDFLNYKMFVRLVHVGRLDYDYK